MAKPEGMFSYSGTFQGVTTVHSRAYGKHLRNARTIFSRSDGMIDSSNVMKKANVYAKVFKDAIDPYRRDFRDGMLWQRSVSIFKNQLHEKSNPDFRVLDGHDLNKTHALSSILSANATISQAEDQLIVNVASRHTKDPTKGRADGYQQTLIVIFVSEDLKTQTFSESKFISLEADPGEQEMRCVVPLAATTAIVVLKCNFSVGHRPMNLQKSMGMKVVGVLAL